MEAEQTRFRRCYERAHADVLRFVRRRVDPSRAEDVVAEAFTVAWRRVAELPRREGEQRAWLFGIARNLLLNDARGEARRRALAVRVATHEPSSAAAADAGIGVLDLGRAFRTLRDVEQEALALALWDGLTSTQAGRVLGISATAYRLRLSRARRALRRALDEPTADAVGWADTEGANR